jgi:putative ABC transport system permease protein
VPKATFGPFEVRWPQVVAPVVLGAVAALLAAYVPARQACRQEVAAVLAGRRGAIRSSRGWPVVGLVLVLGALVLCFTRGTRPGGEIAVATSTVGLVLGTVLLTPLVIGAVAMLGARLPLSLRLAVRDTARQRARSAPAIAAVMASVAAITTLAIASSSDFEQSRREYIYQSSPGRMVLSAQTDELADVIRAASKATHNVKFTTLATAGKYVEDGMSIDVSMKNSDAYDGQNGVVVADAATVDEWGASLDANARRELSRGGIVVYNKSLIVDGKATMLIQGDQEKSIRLPAVVGDLGTGPVPQNEEPQLAGAVISPATAAARHIPSMTTTAVSDRTAAISRADEKAADEAVKGIDPVNGGTYVERGFHESYRLPFLALLGFGILAVLIGTMTATGLALSDARPDFSTLAAIGAAPRTRRRVAGAQAIVLATLGSLLGIAVGFAPGLAATWPLTAQSYIGGVEKVGSPIIAIPWMLLGVIAVAVPMVAAVAAMAFTRSKLVVVRRLAQ